MHSPTGASMHHERSRVGQGWLDRSLPITGPARSHSHAARDAHLTQALDYCDLMYRKGTVMTVSSVGEFKDASTAFYRFNVHHCSLYRASSLTRFIGIGKAVMVIV